MRGRSKRFVVLAGVALLLTLAYFLVARGPVPAADSESSAQPKRGEAEKVGGSAQLEGEGGSPGDGREAVPEPSQSEGSFAVARKEVSRDAPGYLSISAIDANTRAFVDRFRVRAASVARLADEQSDQGSATLDLTLTPGAYSLLVSAQGYEPTELPPVQVPAGETITLDPVALTRGTARIAGTVTGTGWCADLRVELLGEGRRPCSACQFGADPAHPDMPAPSLAWTRAEPCPTCGYAAKSSLLLVQGGGFVRGSGFTFENLASGPYVMRLVDAQRPILGTSKAIVLHEAESLQVELEFIGRRIVRAEIIDTDGTSLATEWATRRRGRHRKDADSGDGSALELTVGEPPRFECAFRAEDACLARASFVPPAPLGPLKQHPSPFGSRRLQRGGKQKTIDDRPRASSEPLRPEQQSPTFGPPLVSSMVDDDGLVMFGSVPELVLTLDMQCESFVATVGIPASREETRVRVQLTNKTKAPPSAGTEDTNRTRTFREFYASLWQ